MYTVSARQLQREYTKILKKANRLNKPIGIVTNNKLQGAVIGINQFEKLRIDAVLKEALEDDKMGRTKTISTPEELETEFARIRKLARQK